LRTRGGELPRMIDHAFAQRKVGFRAHDLGDRNLRALEAGGWLENIDELELVIDRAAAILGASSQRKAADQLGISHTTLSRWLSQRGLAFPVGGR
jgi:transcriptional regulator with PAS, ATPase and Fis domain